MIGTTNLVHIASERTATEKHTRSADGFAVETVRSAVAWCGAALDLGRDAVVWSGSGYGNHHRVTCPGCVAAMANEAAKVLEQCG